MDINDIEFNSGKFNEVWRRVMPDGENNAAQKPEYSNAAAQMRTFMDMEAEAAIHEWEISRRCKGRLSSLLSGVAECDRRHLKELRARYFILTGEKYSPPELCPVILTVAESLRTIYIAKTQLTRDYKEASAKAPSSDTEEMYAQLAEEEGCTAEKIYNALILCLS